MVHQEHDGRLDSVYCLRTNRDVRSYVAFNCFVFCGNPPACIEYFGYMNDGSNLLALNLMWFGWELARWQEVIDWGLSAVGALTLVALNVIRLRKALNSQRDVDSGKN